MTFLKSLFSSRRWFALAVLATICLSRGLDAVSPVTAALTSGIEPILNPVLAAIICGETIGPMSIAGGVLVIGSVLAYSLSQIKRPVSAG